MSRSADEQGARTGTPPGSSSKPMRKLHLSSLRPGPSSGVAAAAAALSEEEAAEMRRATKHLLLAVGMLAAGTANTISAKASFSTLSAGRVERGGTPRPFDHPFVMAGTMFLGEALCLAYHALKVRLSPKKRRRHSFPKIVCALPALCDILATSVMYVGLTLTSASTFQMLRSSAVLFTALLSVIFLKRKQWKFHWVGAALVFLGTLVVGSVSALDAAEDGGEGVGNPRLGGACVVLSQVFYAVQMCLEERFVVGYKIPALQAVGWEGVWGCMGIALLLCALQFLPAGGVAGALPNVVEDSVDALAQLRETPHLVMLLSINSISISFFNWFGISITRSSSAAYRVVLDSLRTLFVWGVGLAFQGERFRGGQVGGFLLLLFGTFVYNEVVKLPCVNLYPTEDELEDAEEERLRHAALNDKKKPLLSPFSREMEPSPSASPTVETFFSPKLSRFNLKLHT